MTKIYDVESMTTHTSTKHAARHRFHQELVIRPIIEGSQFLTLRRASVRAGGGLVALQRSGVFEFLELQNDNSRNFTTK
jgi:hypothetical protein